MELNLENTINSVKEGTKEITDITHEKVSAFNEEYVSKVFPDCGKYGDAAKFAAEMVPGVSEYNAIVDGDWTGFAISAGIDIGAVAVGAFTAGAGYAAVKGGGVAAKAGVKAAAKEIVKDSGKKVTKEITEQGAKKTVKEVTESTTEKTIKESIEKETKKITKKTVEKATINEVKNSIEETSEKFTLKIESNGIKNIVKRLDNKLFFKSVKEVEKKTGLKISHKQMKELKKAIKSQDYYKLNKEALESNHRQYNNLRSKLIKEWEEHTGKKWPTYKEDIKNEKGVVIKKAERPYDVHHLIEQSFGGPNAWWNIHPASVKVHHNDIHGAGSITNEAFGKGAIDTLLEDVQSSSTKVINSFSMLTILQNKDY